jgi:hypothetical protein
VERETVTCPLKALCALSVLWEGMAASKQAQGLQATGADQVLVQVSNQFTCVVNIRSDQSLLT